MAFHQQTIRRPARLGLWVKRTVLAATFVAAGTVTALARQSAIIVDANTGEVVHASQPDAQRFPASLTKVMTLYLLFEQLEAGRLNLNSRLRVSAQAARQPPTKLGVRPGDTIRVEDAILALVTRSANDVAVVVAENIAGSEDEFAERMTQRARQIGMSRTTFQNASGLPNSAQVTTARDMALLGRAMYERFPQYSRYFSRRSFAFGRQNIRNHNRLLGRIDGIDGIKTGYTNASGFNLITSARSNGRHLVGVVMGGSTAASRDAQMLALVRRHFPQMATRRTDFSVAQRVRGRGAGPMVASRQEAPERTTAERAAAASRTPPAPAQVARAEAPPRPAIVPVPAPVPAGPPIVTAPAPAPMALASAATPPAPAPAPQPVQVAARDPLPGPVRASAGGPILQWQTGPQPVRGAEPVTTASVAAVGIAREPAAVSAPSAPQAVAASPAAAATAQAAGGWVVQIAATASETDAQRMLREAQDTVGRRLGRARPVTERVQRGNATLYRARFAGFEDRSQAEAACAALKRNDYDCMAIRL